MKFWTETEINLIWNNISRSTKDIYVEYCNQFGSDRSYDSIQKKVKEIREAHSPGPEDPSYTSEDEILERAFADLFGGTPTNRSPYLPESVKEQRKEDKEKANIWLKGLLEYGTSLGSLSTRVRPKISEGTTLCVVLSDWHIGKFNAGFDIKTARERAAELAVSIYNKENVEDITEVALFITGDMIEGEDVYPSQASHIECPVIDQLQECVEALWDMILNFRRLFQCRVSIYSVPGNHGRVSKTVNEKTNWDNFTYYALYLITSQHGDPEIVFTPNYNEFLTLEVQGKKGMLNHQGVKHTGTPAMREKIAGWVYSKGLDFFCQGHWHSWNVGTWQGRVVVQNGCLCGPDDLSERMGKEDPARQAYFRARKDTPLFGFGFVEWTLLDE